jgi:serine/threonine protein kinase/regulator of sirC expression with transglutaminase-like and TPR domain
MATHMNDNRAATLEEALNQFINMYLRGQKPNIDEFVERYPQCEVQLKKRIQDLHKINNLFDSLVQTDKREFEGVVDENNLVGRKVGSFEIIEIIGRGGMGVVYLARDTKLKRSVAIKSIPSPIADNSKARMRLRREAELLASLNHPNIAVIHEIIEQDEGARYLILEYVPGETLAERIVREPLSVDEALSISQQVAEAISAAHEKGIVHRDLKPGNIKIMPDGRVKVLDFGLAKVPASEGKSSGITETQPGQIIGTPAYMSPEQARGNEIDHLTDIWSFGCIMYQMLTGQLPFEGETATDTLARIIERQPDWNLLPGSTPTNIRSLLRRCLEKDPNQRLGDITDVAREISETLSKLLTEPTTKILRIAMFISVAIIIGLSGFALLLTSNEQYPTKNAQAYEYYRRGGEYFVRDDTENNLELAIGMFEKAIGLDPNFALAYALLSRAHSHMYWFKHDFTNARLVKAKGAVDKALEIDPDLPEAHHSLGCYYYFGYLDYDHALEEFTTALSSKPNSGPLLAKIAYVYRRQGKMEEAKTTLEQAIGLAQLDPGLQHNQGLTLILLRKYPEALSYFNRAIAERPDFPDPYAWKAKLYVRWKGNTIKARKVLEETSKYPNIVKEDSVLLQWVLFDIFDENYRKALDRLSKFSSEAFQTEFLFVPKAQLYAQINGLIGNRKLEQKYYESIRSLLISRIDKDPNNEQFHSKLGIAYAGLGHKEDAISEGERAVQLLPISKEAWQGLYAVEDLARIYVMVGEHDQAIDQLEYLLSIPGELSIPLLQLDPAWDPLRNHPRFMKLVGIYK